ncbi:MAG: YaaA family protein [Desulfobacter sp.]
MKLILSPTKTMASPGLDAIQGLCPEEPEFAGDAARLIRLLGAMDEAALQKLLKTNDALTLKTLGQIQGFDTADPGPAVFAFRGEAFKTLAPGQFDRDALAFCNAHLRILSGLYGVLRPLDRIKPYRLDFNTPLDVGGVSLKTFWRQKLVPYFEALAGPEEYIVNLASGEYSSALSSRALKQKMIHIQFRENTDKRLKNIPVRAKQARGAFAAHIVKHRITRPQALKKAGVDGYTYAAALSSELEWFFIR